MSTTSLKLPDDVKQLAIAAARHQGISPHAFMVDAIRTVASAADRRAAFIAEALAAKADFLRTGKGYEAAQVHSYIKLRAQGKKAARPKIKSWRA
jgi:hypothetical protein